MLWEAMTPPDFELLDPARAVALLPVGAIEQHGPHLPLATDAIIAEQIAHRAAAATPADVPLLVLPTLNVGKSNEHIDYPGTLTFSADTLTDMWFAVGEGVHRAGLRKLIIVNAHGGQLQLMQIVARELRVRHQMLVVFANTWSLGYPPGVLEDEEARYGIHGGQSETSIMLYLRPDLVRMEHARNFTTVLPEIETEYQHLRMIGDVGIGWQAQDVSASGVAGNAAIATAETGEAIVMHCASAFAELFAEVSSYPLARIASHPAVPGTP